MSDTQIRGSGFKSTLYFNIHVHNLLLLLYTCTSNNFYFTFYWQIYIYIYIFKDFLFHYSDYTHTIQLEQHVIELLKIMYKISWAFTFDE